MIMDLKHKPKEYNKLFFGDYGNFQRLDVVNYDIFKKLAENSEGNVWFINEIDCSKDRKGWDKLPETAKRMFHLNILYQNAMDSLVPNTFAVLSEVSTDTWLSYLYSRISTEEQIHCLPEDEEILTENGWVKLKELRRTDKVANWWQDGTITFTVPTSIMRQQYKGPMVNFSQGGYHISVTPKHRVVHYNVRRKRWEVKQAKDCSVHNSNLPVSGYGVGAKKQLTPLERLAIAFQADGSYGNSAKYQGPHKTKNGWAFTFSFKKERKKQRLEALLTACGASIGKVTIVESQTRSNYTTYYVWVNDDFAAKFDKEFAWIAFEQITSEWGQQFIEELKYWDGSRGASNEHVVRYVNTNKKAVDNISAVAALSGYRIGLSNKHGMGGYLKSTCYMLHLYPKTHATGREIKKYETDFDGRIVGVEVPSSFIVVRSKGRYISVTGNSTSYSSGLIQAFGAEASKMLDYVYDDKILQKRTDKEIESAERFIEIVVKQGQTSDDAKKALLLLLLRTYFLEGVKFPFSFFVTWVINKAFDNSIQGFSLLLRLIAWDEMTVHTVTGQNVLNILMTDESQGFTHLLSWFKKAAIEMAKETAELEKEWNEYLLADGPILGYNKEIGRHFIEYWTDYRLNKLKLPSIFNVEKSETIDWYNEYRDLNKSQIALQEADNTNYQKGKLKDDLERFDRK